MATKVVRHGQAFAVDSLKARHKRNCSSAPKTPTGLAVTYVKHHVDHDVVWRARVTFDEVKQDVASRPISVDGYEIQLRSTNASGVPTETGGGGAVTNATDASSTFTFTTGSPHRLNPGDAVAITGCTPSAYNGNYAVATVVSATKFTVAGSPGVADLTANGRWETSDVWRQFVDADDDLRAVFAPLPKPKTNYYQGRVRALNRSHGGKCWSAWTSWSAATQPVSGAIAGPPAPSGLTLGADKVEGTTKHPWRLRVGWNEVGTWTQAEGDPVDGVDGYHVQLQVATTAAAADAVNLRRQYVPSDPLATTAHADFFNGKGPRFYRARVFAVGLGRPGAWTSWTSWLQPKALPDAPRNVTTTNPTPAILVASWDPPVDATDIDRYRVQIIKASGGGGTVVDEGFTSGNRWHYNIPKAARDTNHRARVYSVVDNVSDDVDAGAQVGYETTESTGIETGDIPVDLLTTVAELDVTTDTARLLGPAGVPRVRLRRAAPQTISTDNDETIVFDTLQVDTDGFAAASMTQLDIPWDGSYRVTATGRFASNTTNRRTIYVQDGIVAVFGGVIWSTIAALYVVGQAITGDVTTVAAVNTIQMTGGQVLRVRVYQNSGGGLALQDASLAIEFLGPI